MPAVCLQVAGKAGGEAQEHGEVFAEVWWWRELMQRLMDGCATTDHMLAAGLSAYEELPGPNVPVTSGYQVRRLYNTIPAVQQARPSWTAYVAMAEHCCFSRRIHSVLPTGSRKAGVQRPVAVRVLGKLLCDY